MSSIQNYNKFKRLKYVKKSFQHLLILKVHYFNEIKYKYKSKFKIET